MSDHEKLSHAHGLGEVVLCRNCEDVHISVGPLSFRVPRELFPSLVGMMQSAASHPLLTGAEPAGFYSLSFKEGVPLFTPLKEGRAS